MKHWSYQAHLAKLAKKVAGFQRGLARSDSLSILNASTLADNVCNKKMLSIDSKELEKIISLLNANGKSDASAKLAVWLCYVEQLKSLLDVNLRELVALTRDDVMAAQRVVTTQLVAGAKKKEELASLLVELMLDCAEAEDLDREVERIGQGSAT